MKENLRPRFFDRLSGECLKRENVRCVFNNLTRNTYDLYIAVIHYFNLKDSYTRKE